VPILLSTARIGAAGTRACGGRGPGACTGTSTRFSSPRIGSQRHPTRGLSDPTKQKPGAKPGRETGPDLDEPVGEDNARGACELMRLSQFRGSIRPRNRD
jgi:hypothetical protein